MKKLLIVDGHNVMFRAYYATAATGNIMRNSKGVPTNMVYGFINIINKQLKDGYTHIAVCFDKGKKTRRHLAYEGYKANRSATPEEFIIQVPFVHEYLDCMNIKYYETESFEADDLVASLEKNYSDDFDEIYVLSNDFDLCQLISDNHFQIINKKSEIIIYSPQTLFDEKGIWPNQVTSFKGMVGDSSDNLFGVTGIGDGTAAKYLQQYGTLDGIYEHLNELTPKKQEIFIRDKEQAYFTLDLATLDPAYTDFGDVSEIELKAPNNEKLREFYITLEFSSFLSRMPKEEIKYDISYTSISREEEFLNLISNDLSYVVLDTLKPNYHKSEIVGLTITQNNKTYFVSKELLETKALKNFFEGDSKKVFFDLKRAHVALSYIGITLSDTCEDILLASYLNNQDSAKDDFSYMAEHYGIYTIRKDIDVYGKEGKEVIPADSILANHLASKAYILSILYPKILSSIKEKGMENLYFNIELPLSRTLSRMEIKGLRVSQDELDRYEMDCLLELKECENNIFTLANHEFNISSPKQLSEVLFDELGLKSFNTGKKAKSTEQGVLEFLEKQHPIVKYILKYRLLSKLETTYCQGIKDALSDKGDSHIHTIYRQTLTDTGRLSSIEPNLQNLPRRKEEANLLRKAFVGEEASVLMSSDYSQIELRVLAHMSGDANMSNAFTSGADIHRETAKLIFHKDEVTENERSKAKVANFGIIYGMSPWGLANDTDMNPQEARIFIEAYHRSFPSISIYRDKIIEEGTKDGFVSTMFGRRRYIRGLDSSQYMEKEAAKRNAFNAPIQGTAADILKMAMIAIEKELLSNNLKSFLVLTIHDEVVLNVYKDELDIVEKLVKDTMENIYKLNVPLVANVSYGENLYEAK